MRKNKNKQTENTGNSLQVAEIDLNNIVVTYNPRQSFDENKIKELAESIKQIGIIQPITVRPVKDKENMFEIVCGERRYRASKLAEKKNIPAYIRECTDDERKDIAFVENIQREDVNDIEIAIAVKDFIDCGKEDFNSMAIRLGKSVKYVRDRYQLNNLIDDIKLLFLNDSITLGKAIILASYSNEIQEDVYTKHLKAEDYLYWGNYSQSKFVNSLDSVYNSNLNNAVFDKSECQSCTYNSAVSDLFASESDCLKCLKKECFLAKTRAYKITHAEALLDENPTYLIVKSNASDWFLQALKEKGFETADIKYQRPPSKPDLPEEPKEEDFIDDETGELDKEWFNDALEDFNNEMEEYNSDFKEYETDLQTVEQAIKNGEIEPCFLIQNDELVICYRSLYKEDIQEEFNEESQEEQESQDEIQKPVIALRSTTKAQIVKLQEQDNRNKEIKVENIVKDIKEQVVKKGVDLSKNKGVKLEQNILFYYLIGEMSEENRKCLFGESYPTDKVKFEFVQNLSEEQRTVIIRDFIISKLRNYAYGVKTIDAQLLIEFSKLHFEKETLEIEMKYQEVYNKRKTKIDEKIADISNPTPLEEAEPDSQEVTTEEING